MNITAHAEGMALIIQSMQLKGNEADRLFSLAMQKFETALSSALDNRHTLQAWADALAHHARRKEGQERDKLVHQASEKYLSIQNHKSLVILALSLLGEAVKVS